MFLYGDYHTHTIYSKNHGKSTIMDNAIMAKNKGLKQIAVTDHGFNHLFFGYKKSAVVDIKKEFEAIKNFIDFDILYGIEANIISADGDIDLDINDFPKFDLVLCGYHKLVKYKTAKDRKKLFYPNVFNKTFKRNSEKQKEVNTLTYLKMLDKYPINVITHMGDGFPVDVLKVAKKCVEKNVLVELNGKRINFTDDEIQEMVKMGVQFIVNSDAHSSDRVGEVDNGLAKIIKNKIPFDQIVNINKDISYFKK